MTDAKVAGRDWCMYVHQTCTRCGALRVVKKDNPFDDPGTLYLCHRHPVEVDAEVISLPISGSNPVADDRAAEG